MTLFSLSGRGIRLDPYVPGVQPRYEAFDGPTLAGRVPAFEHHGQPWPEAAVAEQAGRHQTKLEQPPAEPVEALLALGARHLKGKVNLVEPAHRRYSSPRHSVAHARPNAVGPLIDIDRSRGRP